MSIADVAQTITQHASHGPSDTPGQIAKNSLSPSFEHLVQEIIRGHIIKSAQAASRDVYAEFQKVENLTKAEVELLWARVNEIIHNIYK